MYNIECSEEELELVSTIKQSWDDLLLNAKVCYAVLCVINMNS